MERLRSNDHAEGLLFELRTGIHYKSRGLPIKWLPNLGEKPADLAIILGKNQRVLVECIHRQKAIRRTLSESFIFDDLLKAAKNKLYSRYDWQLPRIVVIKVPEEIDWEHSNIKSLIDKSVSNWHHQGRLRNVNAFIFMGEEGLVFERGVIYPDQKVYLIENKFAPYPLPLRVKEHLAIRNN